MEELIEGILVTGLFFMAFSADFLRLLNRLPRGGTTHKERNLPQQSLIKKKYSHRLACKPI